MNNIDIQKRFLIEAIRKKLEEQQLATIMNYINAPMVEDAMGMDTILQLPKVDPTLAMMTASPEERNLLRQQLNDALPGFGEDPDRVEEFARMKMLKKLRALKNALANGAPISSIRAELSMIDDSDLLTILKELSK